MRRILRASVLVSACLAAAPAGALASPGSEFEVAVPEPCVAGSCVAQVEHRPAPGDVVTVEIDWDHAGPDAEGFAADQSLVCAGLPLAIEDPVVEPFEAPVPPVPAVGATRCSAESPPYALAGDRSIVIRFTGADGAQSFGRREVSVAPAKRPGRGRVSPPVGRPGAHLPARGKVWHGVTGGREMRAFTASGGKRPAVWQHFVRWGGGFDYALREARTADARAMLHISTAGGQRMPESISPGAIARGKGDDYLLRLNRRLATHGDPVYLRLMGEMNNCNNAYAAYNCNGSRRNAAHSPGTFKQAWKRTFLIVRGGDVRRINRRLRAMRLPALRASARQLPRPSVAFMWAPMTRGAPMIGALEPGAYWPGRAWVDWVGTSFYSKFPNFGWLETFYRRYAVGQRKPFAVAEWAMWGADAPGFARQLFAWVARHPRVRMMQYNQGDLTDGPFRLRRYPRAAKVIRDALEAPRFAGADSGG